MFDEGFVLGLSASPGPDRKIAFTCWTKIVTTNVQATTYETYALQGGQFDYPPFTEVTFPIYLEVIEGSGMSPTPIHNPFTVAGSVTWNGIAEQFSIDQNTTRLLVHQVTYYPRISPVPMEIPLTIDITTASFSLAGATGELIIYTDFAFIE